MNWEGFGWSAHIFVVPDTLNNAYFLRKPPVVNERTLKVVQAFIISPLAFNQWIQLFLTVTPIKIIKGPVDLPNLNRENSTRFDWQPSVTLLGNKENCAITFTTCQIPMPGYRSKYHSGVPDFASTQLAATHILQHNARSTIHQAFTNCKEQKPIGNCTTTKNTTWCVHSYLESETLTVPQFGGSSVDVHGTGFDKFCYRRWIHCRRKWRGYPWPSRNTQKSRTNRWDSNGLRYITSVGFSSIIN